MKGRKTVLLQACLDMLKKIEGSPYVLSPFETTVHYDDADCDGYCLMEDIEDELAGDACPNCAPGDPCKDCLQAWDDKYADEKIQDQKEGR
jgi:hypothetical protein